MLIRPPTFAGSLTKPRLTVALALATLLFAAGTLAYGRATSERNRESRDSTAAPAADARLTSAANLAIPVEGAPVQRGTLTISVSATGQAAPSRVAAIFAQIAGRVRTLSVREGDRVAAGWLLVALDPAEFQLAVDDARARLSTAQAQYRELTLFDDRITDAAIRAERQRGARAKSGIDAAEIALRRAQLDLSRTRWVAPFSGAVASVKVAPGQFVRAGDEILIIQALDPIKVEVRVLESEIGFLARGREAIVSFAAFPTERFIGRIETINPVVETDTRTARVTVAVANSAGRILPGMYARVSLAARQFADRTLVPRAAILERDRRTMLFVYEKEGEGDEGRAKWRYVTTGLANDSVIEIVPNPETEMVEPGEIVLTDGHYTLIHDAKIRVVTDAQAAGGRPQ